MIRADEVGDGAIVGALHVIRKVAGRQLAFGAVVGETIAAEPFSGARLVGAVALFHVFVGVAVSQLNLSIVGADLRIDTSAVHSKSAPPTSPIDRPNSFTTDVGVSKS